MPRPLALGEDGTQLCTLVEATRAQAACPPCNPQLARVAPSAELAATVRAQLATAPGLPCGPDDPSCSRACLCELQQVQQVAGVDGDEVLRSCEQDLDASGLEGWCCIDPARGKGSYDLVRNCPANEPRRIRFLGQAPTSDSTVLTVCPTRGPDGPPLGEGR